MGSTSRSVGSEPGMTRRGRVSRWCCCTAGRARTRRGERSCLRSPSASGCRRASDAGTDTPPTSPAPCTNADMAADTIAFLDGVVRCRAFRPGDPPQLPVNRQSYPFSPP